MAFPVSVGVYVREFDLTTVIPNVATTDAAFAGVFKWGPMGKRILVDSEDILYKKFGSPSTYNAETWFTAANFLSYGNRLHLVRAGFPLDELDNDEDDNANTTTKTTASNTTNGSSNVLVNNTSGISVGDKVFYSSVNTGITNASVSAVVNSICVTLNKAATNTATGASLVFRADTPYSAVGFYEGGSAVQINEWYLASVLNEDHYADERDGQWAAANGSTIAYVAKYPGDLGNSIRVGVCDTANQYSKSYPLVNGHANAALMKITAPTSGNSADLTTSGLYGTYNSAVLRVQLTPTTSSNADHLTACYDRAVELLDKMTVGDYVSVGNSRIGSQTMKVYALGSVANMSANGGSYFQITCVEKLMLKGITPGISYSYRQTDLTRRWEFYNVVDHAPGVSEYSLAKGNGNADELHVVVVDNYGKISGTAGTILEVWNDVSRATDAKSKDGASIYYKQVINDKSQYIWWANDRTGAPSNTAGLIANSTQGNPLNAQFVGGSDGPGESDVQLSVLMEAYDMFRSAEDVDISLVLAGKARGSSAGNYSELANYLLDNIVEGQTDEGAQRRDCVLFVSPDRADVVDNQFAVEDDIVAFRNSMRSSSYYVIDSGYKYQYDKYNDVYRWVPLNGDIAGLCVRTDLTNDPWWSPAGFTRGQIKNVVRLAWNPRKAQRDTLYQNNINPVVTFPGEGTILYGDKTGLTRPSAFDRINVRRLFIVLEKAISLAAKYFLFEFNDAFTRAQFRNLVVPYLRDIQSRRGIQDFLVVCDETNNTPEVIDRNQFVGDIYIKPARSINFINLNFVAVRTGVAFSEVVGKFA